MTSRDDSLRSLRTQIVDLIDRVRSAERDADLSAVHPDHRAGAANLVHYLALRSMDLRALQVTLSRYGLSSLGRMEPRVLDNLTAIGSLLAQALGDPDPAQDDDLGNVDRHGENGGDALRRNADALFAPEGSAASTPGTRIMVTLPSETADDADLVGDIIGAGADAVRINCAHDDPDAWRAMARHAREADPDTVVSMDLGGPKLRTGPLVPGPHVLKVKPRRDQLGRVVEPGLLWLVADGAPDDEVPFDDLPSAPVTGAGSLAELSVGRQLGFYDTRGRRRVTQVVRTEPGRVLIATERTFYLTPGTSLRVVGDGADAGDRIRLTVGELPSTPRFLGLRAGQRLAVTADDTPVDPDGVESGAATIGCTLPEIFGAVAPGHRILFDDGKIEGIVESVDHGGAEPDSLVARIVRAGLDGAKLRAGKGINLPDTSLPVPALTEDDRKDLVTVTEIADIVALSFVRSPRDVAQLFDALEETGGPRAGDLGVVLKIETVAGFTALPQILLELMRRRRVGVMIARGDLAVEAGFERLAEIQEEILWLCEAAHVPVIWATQVLDSLAGNGLPTRAEVTDAGVARRAECAMLNKGPNIIGAIAALEAILGRMGEHVDKKSPLLRRITVWDGR